MKHHRSSGTSPTADSRGVARRLWCGWRPPDAAERYLAAATDLADLERRMRAVERSSGGPALMTFNH